MATRPPLDGLQLEAWARELHEYAEKMAATAPDYATLFRRWEAKVDGFGWFSQRDIDQAFGSDRKVMLWWDGLVFDLQQRFVHSPVIEARMRAGTFPLPPPERPLDEDCVIETWFEERHDRRSITINIRRETRTSPWRIAVGIYVERHGPRIEVAIPAADSAGFMRSEDARRRGLELARHAIEGGLV